MISGFDERQDVELVALLATRLCHDLAGPVGAVSAGVELLADEADPAFIAEATALLRHSAEASSARLKFFRAAFGEPGRSSLSAPTRALIEGYLRVLAGSISLDWRDRGAGLGSASGDTGAARLLLNLCLTAADCLGAGGALTVELHPATAAGRRFIVTAEGNRLALDSAVRAALRGDRSALSPRSAQAYLLHRLAEPGGGLLIEEIPGRLLLAAVRPAADEEVGEEFIARS